MSSSIPRVIEDINVSIFEVVFFFRFINDGFYCKRHCAYKNR